MANGQRIIVTSKDTDNTFHWASDGWNGIKDLHNPDSIALMNEANEVIKSGIDVPDCIAKLEQAGFTIVRKFDI